MRLFMLLLVGLLYSQQLLAWGKTGHRVIGEIAEHYLSPSARLTVAELLIDEGLAEASTWADFMRSNQDEFWQKTATPWHYVTVPRRFIVHIVGDLHQPLHVGNGEDKGGNDFDVVYFDQPTNLHRVWDSQIIDNEKLSFSEKSAWLLEKISAADFRAWNNPDPLVWIAESAVWRDQLYPAEIRLKWNYDYQWLPVINQRLSQAGVRVAAYLNTLLVPAAAMQPPVAAE
jgi:hypothetical protein